MNKKPTLAEVAAAAGVSSMTASRALRRAKDVSAATIEKVEKAAASVGYVGNSLAQSLSSQRTDLIAVIMPSLTNTVFPEVLAGIAEATESHGLQPVFGLSEYDPAKELRAIRSLLSWKPAAFAVPGVDQLPEAKKLLQTADIPVVQVMDLCPNPIDSCVGFSHHQSGRDMAEALLAHGYRRFSYVGSALQRDLRAAKRRNGFAEKLAEHDLKWRSHFITDETATMHLGSELTGAVIDSTPDTEVIYYANDDMAAGGVFECQRRKIQIPQDLVLAGFNGLDITDALPIQIVTARSPRFQMGLVTGNLLADNIKQKQPRAQRIQLPPTIDLGDLGKMV